MFNLSLLQPASLALQVGPSPIIPPVPDFGICDRRYGSSLMPLLCGRAADTLTQGDSLVPYTVHGGDPGPQPQTLPYTVLFGNCKVWVEVAGPATPQIYEVVPNEIRGLVAWVIEECVGVGHKGYGGFATKDISKLTTYVTESEMKIGGTYRKCAVKQLLSDFRAELGLDATATSTAFLTVTITDLWDQSSRPPSPGDYDPSIAEHLAEAETDAWNKAAPGSPLRRDLASRQQFFSRQSVRMQTGGSSITWWGSNPQSTTLDIA